MTVSVIDEFAMTPHEHELVEEYDRRVGGVPDTFDCAEDVDLVRFAPLLTEWWSAVESLAARGPVEESSRGFRFHVQVQRINFDRTRDLVLEAIARRGGHDIPGPFAFRDH